MAGQTFHQFPDLPREIRDEIWRQCLPHRVVELDLPDLEWYFEDGYRQSYPDLDKQRQRPCELWPSSLRNRAPPTISRVCHESRKVAFETAQLSCLDHLTDMSPAADECTFWMDFARDTLHLHWHMFISGAGNMAGPFELYQRLSPKFHTASISADLFDAVRRVDRRYIMGYLMKRPSWSVCGALVWIHATDEAAIIESDLWGSLGDESIVLVDARDATRVARFREFWQTHGTEEDVETKAFFEACVDDVPKIHYLETPTEFLHDLQIRWLHDSMPIGEEAAERLQREIWLTTPGDFDGQEDDPRLTDYGHLPGRPFARQLWSPNREHLWVRETLAQMPVFQPTVMFRLCRSQCLLKELDMNEEDGELDL